MLSLVLSILIWQATPLAGSLFTEKERAQYNEKSNLGDRMQLFGAVVERYRKDFEAHNRRTDAETFMKSLNNYSELLQLIETDVKQFPEEKKRRSKPLRKLEIELRKAREDLQNFKQNISVDQQAVFERRIEQTESVRTTILQFIFGKDLLKTK
ncbi:MAG: hypothetical protein HY644_11680 [Acidobacteria bacterium]|nr:hypothetical protein [Acidobacteriota bacterium]